MRRSKYGVAESNRSSIRYQRSNMQDTPDAVPTQVHSRRYDRPSLVVLDRNVRSRNIILYRSMMFVRPAACPRVELSFQIQIRRYGRRDLAGLDRNVRSRPLCHDRAPAHFLEECAFSMNGFFLARGVPTFASLHCVMEIL